MTARIPMLDLGPQLAAIGDELEKAVVRVLRSGRYILGPELEAFEREVAEHLGVAHAVGLNSGTDALVIALRALDIGPGCEVITSPFTFFASAEAIATVGATPVFADIRPSDFCLDPDRVASRVTSHTRAILPVHLFGHAADMDALGAIATRHGLAMIEDACQAFGATHRGRRIGGLGNAAAFSFFPSKNLGGAGDGGLLTTNDAGIADRARLLRNHGSRQRYVYEGLGYNSRLDEIQAAVLRVRLRHIDAWNEGRRAAARAYGEALAGIDGLVLPRASTDVEHVFHQYTVRVDGGRRDALAGHLDAAGVSTAIYYPQGLHELAFWGRSAETLPVCEVACREVLSLPIWPELARDRATLDRVTGEIHRFFDTT
jgi:dTDP-4-amino-4,6-dideoxygalactose transaminase